MNETYRKIKKINSLQRKLRRMKLNGAEIHDSMVSRKTNGDFFEKEEVSTVSSEIRNHVK